MDLCHLQAVVQLHCHTVVRRFPLDLISTKIASLLAKQGTSETHRHALHVKTRTNTGPK